MITDLQTYKTVKWVLLSLNLCNYTRVCVRERVRPGFGGFVYLGGGYPGKVMQRYGDRLVADSCIYEDALILYVQPVPRPSDPDLQPGSDHTSGKR